MEVFQFRSGPAPLLVSMPHIGTELPPGLAERMTAAGRLLADTDWRVDQLYDFLDDLGANVIEARYSRYVIDLNRPPDGQPLYPGASNTELCPVSTFEEEPIYLPGQAPGEDEVAQRRTDFWAPYHARIAECLEEIRARHGHALLWDAHSIRSRAPRFFDGKLPDLNIGTASGTSASPRTIAAVAGAAAAAAPAYSHVVDGRFKGGYITRRYGRPAEGTEAIQLELSWATYMDEAPPFTFRDDLAAGIRPVLRDMLAAALGAQPKGR